MEGYECGDYPDNTSSTADKITFTVTCAECMDRGSVQKPLARFGKITVTKSVRCESCNAATAP